MADWQATETTIYCDAVDDDVTIVVYKDWSTHCTGHKKYLESPSRNTVKMLRKKARMAGRDLRCEGPLDYRVTNYRDMLIAEDKASPSPVNKSQG